MARKCYKDSLKLKKKIHQDFPTIENTLKVNLVDPDPRGDPAYDSLSSIEELNKVQIGAEEFQVTQIGQ